MVENWKIKIVNLNSHSQTYSERMVRVSTIEALQMKFLLITLNQN